MRFVKKTLWIAPLLAGAYLVSVPLIGNQEYRYAYMSMSWLGVLGCLLLGFWFKYVLGCENLAAAGSVGIIGVTIATYILLTLDSYPVTFVMLGVATQAVWVSFIVVEASFRKQRKQNVYRAVLKEVASNSSKKSYVLLSTLDYSFGVLFLACTISLCWLLLATFFPNVTISIEVLKNNCVFVLALFFVSLAFTLFPRGLARLFVKTLAEKKDILENSIVSFILGGFFVYVGFVTLGLLFSWRHKHAIALLVMLAIWGPLCIKWHRWVSQRIRRIDKETLFSMIERIRVCKYKE